MKLNKSFYVSLLLFILSPSFIFSQNLVPNHSFELLGNLPVVRNKKNAFEFEYQSGYQPFQKNLKFWKAASDATPDLRIIDRNVFRQCSQVYKDCNRPKTGEHFVGIMTYLENTNTKVFREYIQIKLKKTLKPGVKTYAELWIQKDRQAKLVSNNIGFYFSQKKFYVDNEDVIEKIPQINHDTFINEKNLEWVKIEGTFIPDKPLIYVTIGNFYNNENTKIIEFKKFRGSPYTPPYAHYLIDDVRIWQEGDTPDPKTKNDSDKFEISKIKKNEAVILENIFFDYDKATLKSTSFEELEKLFSFLEKNPTVKIAIQGHTDSRGNDNYNLKLSTSRAQSVYNFLKQKGIQPERLKYSGYGESRPIDNNENEEGWQRNRRVEFVILEK